MNMETQFPVTGNADYDALPDSVKAERSFEQYQWLSGAEKARLVQDSCDPEVEL